MSVFDRIFARDNDKLARAALDEYEASVARIVLLCIEDLPFSVGVSKVAQILMGHQTIFLTEHEFISNCMFGRLQQFSKMELTYIIKMLAIHRYIVVHEELKVFEVVSVSPKGFSLLEGRRKLDFHFLDTITETHRVYIDEEDLKYAHALKEKRIELAMKDTGKAYDICDDVALLKMAHARPTTLKQLEEIDGLGDAIIEKYGDAFIETIWNVIKGKDTAKR